MMGMDHTDLFRDTPIRYLGYANEVGEAFRAVIPTKAVWFSYGIACAYVACDAADKGFTVLKKVPCADDKERRWQGLLTACDALLWQSLASIMVPGVVINRLCWATRLSMSYSKLKPFSKVVSVAVGLTAIPFIIKPIDKSVDRCMDIVVRPWLFNTQHD